MARETVIIYASQDRLTSSHQVVRTGCGRLFYIRVEDTLLQDLSDALDAARPLTGEVVLNAIHVGNV